MEMTGERLIQRLQEEVWRELNDPQTLKACIAGCESIEKVSESEYRITLTAAVGPVKARFAGKLVLSGIDSPNAYSLSFEGAGGAAGFGRGGARVSLRPEGGGTRLAYSATASVGGKLAQIGSRLIDSAAKKMADDFFAAFEKKLVVPAAAAAQSPAPARRGIALWGWAAALALLAAGWWLARPHR